MSAREEILNRLRSCGREVSHPAAWRSRRQFDDLAERFTIALTAAKGELHRAVDLASALAQLDRLLVELDANRVVANTLTWGNGKSLNFASRWPSITWHLAGCETGETFRAHCATADVGISGADAALAETGSVVISSGPGYSRLVSLLPPVYIALVATSQLTTDLFTWTAARLEPPPAALTIISGPSKTADIEQTMAIGVHGPRRFIVVLYGDERNEA